MWWDGHVADQRDERVVGVDGCRRGWVGVVLGPGDAVAAVCGATISEVVSAAGDVAVAAVDMPMHLHDALRPCDDAARERLLGKQSSLFLAPPRAVLDAPSYVEACTVARGLTGKAISQQLWALRRKILEVEAWLSSAPCAVYEVHPELSFAEMTGNPILPRKTSWTGYVDRRSALAAADVVVPDNIGEAGSFAAADDVLDAAAAAWSARRIAAGTAVTFPDVPLTLTTPTRRVQAIWA